MHRPTNQNRAAATTTRKEICSDIVDLSLGCIVIVVIAADYDDDVVVVVAAVVRFGALVWKMRATKYRR